MMRVRVRWRGGRAVRGIWLVTLGVEAKVIESMNWEVYRYCPAGVRKRCLRGANQARLGGNQVSSEWLVTTLSCEGLIYQMSLNYRCVEGETEQSKSEVR